MQPALNPLGMAAIPQFSRKELMENYPQILDTADNYKRTDQVEGLRVAQARRLIFIMWRATKHVIDNGPVQQNKAQIVPINKYTNPANPDQKAENLNTTKNDTATAQSANLDAFVEQHPELKAHISCFHMKCDDKVQEDIKETYLDVGVPVIRDYDMLSLRVGQSITTDELVKRIISFGNKSERPMVTALGQYFQYHLDKRKQEIRNANTMKQAIQTSNSLVNKETGPNSAANAFKENDTSATAKQEEEDWKRTLDNLYEGNDNSEMYNLT